MASQENHNFSMSHVCFSTPTINSKFLSKRSGLVLLIVGLICFPTLDLWELGVFYILLNWLMFDCWHVVSAMEGEVIDKNWINFTLSLNCSLKLVLATISEVPNAENQSHQTDSEAYEEDH